jgi:hypothetical protein
MAATSSKAVGSEGIAVGEVCGVVFGAGAAAGVARMSQRFTLQPAPHPARSRAKAAIDAAQDGCIVSIRPAGKTRDQEEKYHPMIADIAKQSDYAGKRWDKDDMKRILIDEFADAMRELGTPLHHDGRLIPSENGRRVIQLGVQSRDFWKLEASEFIEFLYAWGADRGVVWSEPLPPELRGTRARAKAIESGNVDADGVILEGATA